MPRLTVLQKQLLGLWHESFSAEELASCAEQMGAVHNLDLTSDVTHLVVGSVETLKYKFVARERPDVKIVTREWVKATRERWIHDEEIDLDALEKEHRPPLFDGLRLCLTGFDDAERQRLATLIAENGAEYHSALVKEVTHLVAKQPEGRKYRHAKGRGMKVVAFEWLRDSVERGMVLDEALYDPLTPQEERGKNAWKREAATALALGKRSRAGEGTGGDKLSGRRKLRRTASRKLESQNSAIWGEIVGDHADPTSLRESVGAWKPTVDDVSKEQLGVGPEDEMPPRVDVNASVHVGDDRPIDADEVLQRVPRIEKRGIFAYKRFYLQGFDGKQTRILRDHIQSQDGEVTDSLSNLSQQSPDLPRPAAYVVVPHSSPEANHLPLSDAEQLPEVVSEWWIERCLHCRRATDPAEHISSRPFTQFPIPGFDQLTICSTGLGGVDLLHASKAVRLMGAKYEEYLSPSASVLICNRPLQSEEKIKHAVSWGVPVVGAQWLWKSVEGGQQAPFRDFLVPLASDAGGASTAPLHPKAPSSVLGDLAFRRVQSDVTGLKRSGSKTGDGILHGCVVAIGRPLKDEESRLRRLAESLGASVVDLAASHKAVSGTVTHLIWRPGADGRRSKEYKRAANARGCSIVTPSWLRQCARAGKRVDAKAFAVDRRRSRSPAATSDNGSTRPEAADKGRPKAADDNEHHHSVPHHKPEVPPAPLEPAPQTADTASDEVATATKPADGSGPPSAAKVPPSPSVTTTTLHATMAALLAARKKQSSSSSAAAATAAASVAPARLLGRASSNPRTTTTTTTNTTTTTTAPRNPIHSNNNINDDTTNTNSHSNHPEPSQRVIYEDPAAREHRDRVVRTMGGGGGGTVPAHDEGPRGVGGAVAAAGEGIAAGGEVGAAGGVGRKKVARSIGVATDLGAVGTRTRLRTGSGG
ncbi:MAG: hypothetical protein M1826_005605 [Phylliscum demangeonii]|nr:MAG: hypothetical protein M1826_005605 [Phylliscum demangeonii]